MKKFRLIIYTFLLVFLTAGFILPKEIDKSKSRQITKNTVESLLQGVNSDNLGLKTSSILVIASLKIDKAVIPLLKIVKSDKNVKARLSAAYALYRIGDNRGLYILMKLARNDDNPRVRNLCRKLFLEYYKENLF